MRVAADDDQGRPGWRLAPPDVDQRFDTYAAEAAADKKGQGLFERNTEFASEPSAVLRSAARMKALDVDAAVQHFDRFGARRRIRLKQVFAHELRYRQNDALAAA